MEKGKQPTLWNKHHLDNLAREAFRRSEEKDRVQAIDEILDRLDDCEESRIDDIMRHSPLSRFSSALGNAFEVKLSPEWLSNTSVNVKLFSPHERVVDSSNVIPLEVGTSVVALDAYERATMTKCGAKVGSILLFKLSANLIDEPAPDITAKDLAWGENCLYGAFADGNAINYFEIVQASGDVVEAELRRKDPTEESGQSVEMQVVKPGQDKLTVRKLPSLSKEAIELDQEMEKFIQSRQGAVAPDEN